MYMLKLSHDLERSAINTNQMLDVYDACRKELRNPDGTPLGNGWDCEKLIFSDKVSHLLSVNNRGCDYSSAPISHPARDLSYSA